MPAIHNDDPTLLCARAFRGLDMPYARYAVETRKCALIDSALAANAGWVTRAERGHGCRRRAGIELVEAQCGPDLRQLPLWISTRNSVKTRTAMHPG